ncbi:MAG TPA: SurA N-terminal domain-containing protein [Bauldia sp.]
MLDSIRKYANSWVAQVLMGVLVLSFGVWGVADVFTGFRANDIASVGSTQITATDYQRDYEAMMHALSQQVGQELTPDQARQAGIPGQVIGRLVNEATLDNAAMKLKLGISDGTLARTIAANPQFMADGKFNRQYLQQVIRQQGFTENDFIIDQRQAYLRSQLAEAFAGAITAPETYLRAFQDYSTEQRAISYVTLAAPAATAIADPGETDLTTYFNAHKGDWNAPEVRAVSYFRLSPADAASAEEVSDDEAKKAYDAQPDRFSTPEQRDVQQLVFKDSADASAAVASLAGGKTFDDLLADREMKVGDVDLGMMTKAKIADPAVAAAAFSLAEGGVSPLVTGQFGPALVRVTKIASGTTTSFDQAKADLKKEIAQQHAAAEIGDMRDAIEDARAGGATLADAAAKYGLKVVVVQALDASGNDVNGKPVADLPAGLAAAAFQTDVGLENNPIQPDDSSYVWYDVTGVTAPHERPLADVRDQVMKSWKDSQRTKQLDAAAAALKTRLDNKEDLATAAASFGLTVKKADKLTRVTKPSGDLSADALAAIFAAQQGAAAVANGPDPMTRVVLVVDDIAPPQFVASSPETAEAQRRLTGQLTNSLLGLYVAQLQTQYSVKFNQGALQQVLGGGNSAN